MKRHLALIALLVFLTGPAAAHAQQPATPPAEGGVLPAITLSGVVQQLEAVRVATPLGLRTLQRSGSQGRGGPAADPNQTNPDLGREIELIITKRTVGLPNPVTTTISTSRGLLVSPNSGAWWTNAALLTRLGLTDDQKLRIERAFENHRQNLTSSKDALEKEEAQLGKLLDAEPLDRGGVTTQIYKVVQARGEMEKVNALMTLEMREVLTRAQWLQLQVQQSVNVTVDQTGGFGQRGGRGGGLGAGAQRGAGGRGQAGQQ